jgi:hypothetical protein
MVSRGYHWTKHERANVDNSINTFVSTFPSMTSGKRDTSEASDMVTIMLTSPRLLFKYPGIAVVNVSMLNVVAYELTRHAAW